MAVLFKWHVANVKKSTKDEVVRRMAKVTILVRDTVKRKINRGNPRGNDPSLVGEPPKKVTARLFDSITQEVQVEGDDVIGRVGTNVVYARRLELGFHGTDSAGRVINQGPRPYFRPSFEETLPQQQKMLGVK